MQEKWKQIAKNLEKMLDPGIFRIWVAPLSANIHGSEVQISAPNGYMAEWVKRKLKKELLAAASAALELEEDSIKLVFQVSADRNGIAPEGAAAIVASAMPKCDQVELPVKTVISNAALSWRFRFEDFVTGPSNNLAVAAARDLCAKGQVRTLFINSSPGLGKTHLAQAAGCALSETGDRKIAYLTAEQFASRYVAAMRSKELEDLKQYLCGLDALLLEDVHFFQRKKAMQEMILGVVKNLQSRGARIIFTSSFSPRQMQDMDSQLVSQLCSGILTSMEKPGLDMRREILRRKAKSFQVDLPEEVCDVLSRRLSSDVRQLESCLNSMIFKARLLNAGLSVELALETAAQYAGEIEAGIEVGEIVRLVCENYGLTEQQLRSRSRRQEYVHGRNTAFYLARKHTEMSLEEIGCIFNRKHSTVMRGITQVEEEMARESRLGRQFARAVAMIERKGGVRAD